MSMRLAGSKLHDISWCLLARIRLSEHFKLSDLATLLYCLDITRLSLPHKGQVSSPCLKDRDLYPKAEICWNHAHGAQGIDVLTVARSSVMSS